MSKRHELVHIENKPTLEQLLQLIRRDPKITYNNRRRMMSAVSGLVKHAGVDPRTARATFGDCREPLNAIEPAAARITRGHYINIRTYLRIALPPTPSIFCPRPSSARH